MKQDEKKTVDSPVQDQETEQPENTENTEQPENTEKPENIQNTKTNGQTQPAESAAPPVKTIKTLRAHIKETQPSEKEQLPMIPLRGLVLFPNMVLHFDVGRERSVLALNTAMKEGRRVFLITQKDIRGDNPGPEDLYKVGVIAEIRQIVRIQADTLRVLVEGKTRAVITGIVRELPYFTVEVAPLPMRTRIPNKKLGGALVRTVKNYFEEYASLVPQMPRDIIANVVMSEDPVYLGEYIAGNIQLAYEDKQRILEETGVIRRLELLIRLLEEENSILSLERDIHDRVHEQMDRNQREYYLREQMKAISEELGEGDGEYEEIDDYRRRVQELSLDDASREKLLKEIDRIEKMPPNSHEASVIEGWLEVCLGLPWGVYTRDRIDIDRARRHLDRDHYGLKKVKERILEVLAVRRLSPDIKGQIICLVGPPGVGKTSIARSIAETMGRKYVRISLGGVRDESDIRGHRKTYIGSMPGRIMTAIQQSGSANPLMLLDEIDKLGNDFRGDPSSALLEVLDSEQNAAFRDHYIELPFDLSRVFFIATANDRGAIPEPLLDRMEIIELPSYTREEKKEIALRHLVPKQMKRHGIDRRRLKITESAVYDLIDSYTREAGVRSLERCIASLCRKAAVQIVSGELKGKLTVTDKNIEELLGPRKYRDDALQKTDQVGVANGLAWTAVGGEMLQVEAAVMDGTGKNQFTGSLGDVMKESVAAAITYIRGVSRKYDISDTFYKDKDIHIHFPEGAVPKDGPSAGITTCTALVSALSGIPVRHDVAMTGEITLRGRVLAIGGLREKTMAAYKNGMKTVIIPEANLPDLEEIDETVKSVISFVPASDMDTVLRTALAPFARSAHTGDAKAARTEESLPPVEPFAGVRPGKTPLTQ